MRALGIDVGVKKGLDLVLLNETRLVVAVRSRISPGDLPTLIADLRPDVITIDSPPRFGNGAPRKTEVEIRKRGISLYATPWEEDKKNRPFYDWMREGFKAFHACATAGFPLFSDDGYPGSAMEVFPYAVAVVLSGGLRPKGMTKRVWRRGVLASHGVDATSLKNTDQVDAALAALTGLLALESQVCWEGDPSEGVIVLPCRAEDLKQRYLPV